MLLERFVMTVIMMEHQVVLQIAQVLCLGIYVKEEPPQPQWFALKDVETLSSQYQRHAMMETCLTGMDARVLVSLKQASLVTTLYCLQSVQEYAVTRDEFLEKYVMTDQHLMVQDVLLIALVHFLDGIALEVLL